MSDVGNLSDKVIMGNTIEQYRQVTGSFHPTGRMQYIKTCRNSQEDTNVHGRRALLLSLVLLSILLLRAGVEANPGNHHNIITHITKIPIILIYHRDPPITKLHMF